MAQKRNNRAISSVTLAALLSGVKPSAISGSQRISLRECVGTKCYAVLNFNIQSSKTPHYRALRAFIPALEKDGILFGVMLRFHFKWEAEPYSEAAERVLQGPAFEINSQWVQNLKVVVRNELLPLLRILDRPFLCEPQTHSNKEPPSGTRATLRKRIINEVRARGHSELGGLKYFFSNLASLEEWIISSEWENWNISSDSLKERHERAIVKRDHLLTDEGFLDIVRNWKDSGIVSDFPLTLKKRGLKVNNTCSMDYSRIAVAMIRKIKSAERDSPIWTGSNNEHHRGPLIESSYGRGRFRVIDLSRSAKKYACVFPTTNVRTKSVFVDHYWWWRELYPEIDIVETNAKYQRRMSKWPEHLIDTYKDNWERSAFIYEMRARMSERNQWDFFAKPWIKLNYSERSIISILWPPEHFGAYRFRIGPYLDPISGINNEIELREIISLLAPNGAIKEMIIRIINEESKARGIPRPGTASGRPGAPPWRAIEFLDIERYKIQSINSSEHNTITEAKEAYHAACAEIGIEP